MRCSNKFSIHSSIHSNLDSASRTPLPSSVIKLHILVPGSVLYNFLARIYTVIGHSFLNHPHLFDCSFTFYHNCQSFSDYFISSLPLSNLCVFVCVSVCVYACVYVFPNRCMQNCMTFFIWNSKILNSRFSFLARPLFLVLINICNCLTKILA